MYLGLQQHPNTACSINAYLMAVVPTKQWNCLFTASGDVGSAQLVGGGVAVFVLAAEIRRAKNRSGFINSRSARKFCYPSPHLRPVYLAQTLHMSCQ